MYFGPTFFGNIDQLEEGCLQLHVTAGDVLAMPASFLHFVLSKSNAFSLGTNFLAFGYLPMIRHSIIVEFPKRSDDKFPDLPEMLVLLMYRIAKKLCPRPCRRLVSMYSTDMQSLYDEHAAREVRFLGLQSCLVTKLFSIFSHFHSRSNRESTSSSCFLKDFKTHVRPFLHS